MRRRIGIALLALAGIVLYGWGFLRLRERVAPPPDAAALAERFDCAGCHEGPDVGTGMEVPPSLAFEGSRVHEAWLVEYLLDPRPIRYESEGVRPAVGMPDFDLERAEAEVLAAWLASRRDERLVPRSGIDWAATTPEEIEEGRRLFANYQCRGCHRLGGEGGEVGPALDGVARRLQPDFLHAFLRDPERIVPGSPMEDLELWDREAEAIARFLLAGTR